MSRLTMGIEDELFLHRAHDGRLVSAAPGVIGPEDVRLDGGTVKAEITHAQIELVTDPELTWQELYRAVSRLRVQAAARAHAQALLVLPTGTPLAGALAEQTVSRSERYDVIRGHFGRLVHEQQFSGLHVHVGVPDPEHRALVSNALRPWLAVLVALTSNSPYWLGEDTGFASWRVVNRVRWPVSGPPPVWTSFADYQIHLEELLHLRVADDPGAIYWDVRLSQRYPTVEVRIADTPLTVGEAVLVACLVRAIASAALAGRAAPPVESHVLRSSVFAAARGGLDAVLADPCSPHTPCAARDALTGLLEAVGVDLVAAGDAEFAAEQVAAVLARGTGADRQRAAVAAVGGPAAAVPTLALPLSVLRARRTQSLGSTAAGSCRPR